MVATFLAFLAITTALVVGLAARYLGRPTALRLLAGLCVWLAYVGVMSYAGVIRDSSLRPPGMAYLLAPVALFLVLMIFWARSPAGSRIALALPLWVVLGTQTFRVVVELFIHRLWIDGLVPRMLTFEGANVDIYIGVTAPLVAWLSARGKWGLKIALAWNVLGLAALANVVLRAVLTAPGPLNFIRAEVPDKMIGTFPFTFIPAFFVPLAVVLHVLAIGSILARLRAGTTPPAEPTEDIRGRLQRDDRIGFNASRPM